jgi:hypothetical protein
MKRRTTVRSRSQLTANRSGLGGAFRLISEVPGRQRVPQADPTKKLRTDVIRNHIDHFRPVLRWIVVHPEWSLPKGSIDYFDDGVRNARDICIRRHDWAKPLSTSSAKPLSGLASYSATRSLSGMSEVVRAAREGARNNDRGLDTPACQLPCVHHGHRIHTSCRCEVPGSANVMG